MTMSYTPIITIPVSTQLIADLITTALEGGSNYWLESYTYTSRSLNPGPQKPDYADPKLYADPDFNMIFTTIDDELFSLNRGT